MSVKTGAVGSNPRIEKLMDVSVDNLRIYAATTLTEQILLGTVAGGQSAANNTNVSETGKGEQEAITAHAKDSRGKIREIRSQMATPSALPSEGIYIKDSDLEKGNVIQRYKKAADERQLQMEGSSTIAFAEKDALMRNGIDEKDKKEFFANYLSMETEYLVEGALLTCSQATNEVIYINDPEAEIETQYFFEGSEAQTENPLLNVKNPANDGSAHYATVSDTKRNENMMSFRNCKRTNSTTADEAKVLGMRKDCQKYGTCYALMDLCDEWVNVKSGAEYGTVGSDKKNCINMLSHLGCYQGGMIYPLTTGQGETEDEVIEIDFEELAREYGARSYNTPDELKEAALAELIARAIYGEQTSSDGKKQEAVAWIMANRLLSQKTQYEINGELTLFTVVTQPSQFTAIEGEEKNDKSFTSKKPDDYGYKGWVNAVKLGYYLTKTFDEDSSMVDLSEDELDDLRSELTDCIGESPIGNARDYRAEKTFDRHHTVDSEGKHYFNGVEIEPEIPNLGGNKFFTYVK